MSMIDKYPSIRNAALLIAYDNSMINRWTTESQEARRLASQSQRRGNGNPLYG